MYEVFKQCSSFSEYTSLLLYFNSLVKYFIMTKIKITFSHLLWINILTKNYDYFSFNNIVLIDYICVLNQIKNKTRQVIYNLTSQWFIVLTNSCIFHNTANNSGSIHSSQTIFNLYLTSIEKLFQWDKVVIKF